MLVNWLQAEMRARCPVCGADRNMATLLTTAHVVSSFPPVKALRCGECSSVFLEDLTPPEYGNDTPEMLEYYVEQGAGIDLVVAPFLRIPADTVRRCLEIGCSYPFALDFARFTFGWETLGVDPSPLAVKGAAALGVPVLHTYFDAALDVGPQPFDLVFCSEILEHVADPHSLLSSIRHRLPADGLLVLSTPNANILRPETEEGMLARALSPGFHLILYTPASLARVLAMAGFTCIVVEESPETLRAFASCSPAPIHRLLPPDPAAVQTAVRTYLGERTKQVPVGSVLACGLAYRHLKECVNAGLYDEAVKSRERLAAIYRECYGLDLHAMRFPPAARLPFNLCSTLFFSGILELNGLNDPARAAEAFAAAVEAARRILEGAAGFAIHDGETEGLLRQSLKHLPMALAATDPQRALRELAKLEAMDPAQFPGVLLDEARIQTFIRLVNAGAYSSAQSLASRVGDHIEARETTHALASDHSLDALYCLGMLALQTGSAGDAAKVFRRVTEAVERSGSDDRLDLARTARYHEALSLEQAGQS
jgi:SAM-dependent methyltransferase